MREEWFDRMHIRHVGHPCGINQNLKKNVGHPLLTPFKVPKKESYRTHCPSLIAQRPGLPLGELSCLIPDRAGGRETFPSVFTLFGGGFAVVLPFFCWTEGPRDWPGGALRDVLLGHTDSKPAPVNIVFYSKSLQTYSSEDNHDQAELSSGGPLCDPLLKRSRSVNA